MESSSATTAVTSLDAWAKSLVGRDWEIFWRPDDKTSLSHPKEEEQAELPTPSNRDQQPQQQQSAKDAERNDAGESPQQWKENAEPMEGDDDDEDDDDDEFEEDWYDGCIEGIDDDVDESSSNGTYSFQIRFVGDDNIYHMVLEPSAVRPSARAWIKRSRAILELHREQQRQQNRPSSHMEWEENLPPDTTMTTQDMEALRDIQKDMRIVMDGDSNVDEHHDSSIQGAAKKAGQLTHHDDMPDQQQLDRVRRLVFTVRSQIYLRSKLAPIVGDQGTGGASETHVSHLVECLHRLEEACRWYCQCWDLHKAIFPCSATESVDHLPQTAQAASQTNVSESNSTATTNIRLPLDEDYAVIHGLQQGRRAMIQLLMLDPSPAGAKRRRPFESQGGTRKTKRRRKAQSFQDFIRESGRVNDIPCPADEDEFLSSELVQNFVEQVRSNDHRWYIDMFCRMMHSVSCKIVAPLISWKRRVNGMLLVSPEEEVGSGNNSDGETSEEDNDDDHSAHKHDAKNKHEEENEATKEWGRRCYHFDEINLCRESADNDPVLRCFHLISYQDRLSRKLSEIESFESRAWGLIARLFGDPESACNSKDGDDVFSGLVGLKASILSPESQLSNVHPFGRSASVLSRVVVDEAIAIRSWYLDLHRIELSKERLVFIDKMAVRASELPRLPHCDHSSVIDDLFDKAIARLRKISQGYFDHLARFNKYRSVLLGRTSVTSDDIPDFFSREGVFVALQELSSIQVLSIAEEMLAVRIDVLSWKERAAALMSKDKIPFAELEEVTNALHTILNGQSPTRVKLLQGVEANDKVDSEIRSFVGRDVDALCGAVTVQVNGKYSSTLAWKERADAIINSLELHKANQASHQKTAPMIDLKRITGLLAEYGSLDIFLPDHRAILELVCAEASKWSSDISSIVRDEMKSSADLLVSLKRLRTNRPRGIIQDPARHVVDTLVDLLAWHHQVKEASIQLVDMLRKEKGSPQHFDINSWVSKVVYPLIMEGLEVLELFSLEQDGMGTFPVVSAVALELLCKELDSRRPMRSFSRAKLEPTSLGNAILHRLVSNDEKEDSPMRFLVFFLWRASVIDFVRKFYKQGDKSKQGKKDFALLEAAQRLYLQKPHCQCVILGGDMWEFTKGADGTGFMELLGAGEAAEVEGRKALGTSKELLRGAYRQRDAITKHLLKVKELNSDFRTRMNDGTGLILDKALEQKLDHNLKVLSWLVRTFPYPFFHTIHYELSPEGRIPWDVLISLNDRKPTGTLDDIGDTAGVALRVKELWDAANKWQEEITKVTMLSYRGGKRRVEVAGGDADTTVSTVEVQKVRRLAGDPILQKVVMPREDAVSHILASAKSFERLMEEFLGQDYDGASPDRAPYPDARSLIGTHGEFLLYRLTGSPLYESLINYVETIAMVAQDVLADTPGKAAFEWIRRAVVWIDTLRAAVTRMSHFGDGAVQRLVIPEAEGKRILEMGKAIFLDIPDDLNKTLSKNKIYLSKHRTEEKLVVVFRKDGAHQSVGGSAIRWCPVLFESLYEDVARLNKWKSDVEKVQEEFASFSVNAEKWKKNDEDVVHQLHAFSEEVGILVEEGMDILVVAPRKSILDTLNELRGTLETHLIALSCPAVDEKIAKRQYEDAASLELERFQLLDSLVCRRALEFEKLGFGEESPPLRSTEVFKEIRDRCRNDLEKALWKGMQVIDLREVDVESTLGAVKAWEIELELYSRFQTTSDETALAKDYEDVAQSLCRRLEDPGNRDLCVRVLAGEIEAAELLSNSSEQPGNDDTKLGLLTTVADETDDVGQQQEKGSIEIAPGCPKDKSMRPPNQHPLTRTSSADGSDEAVSPPTTRMNAGVDAADKRGHDRESTAYSSHKSSTSPPLAPPSLASLVTADSTAVKLQSKGSKGGNFLKNTEGGDLFRFTISKSGKTHKFTARLCVETPEQASVNGCLPETLAEKGRLELNKLVEFISQKLKGETRAIHLRLSVGTEDAKAYKRFCKDYEQIQRLAMCSIEMNSKLFLVTPKYHQEVEKVIGKAFAAKGSTYAVVLTKGELATSTSSR